jgi:hypothetical protein
VREIYKTSAEVNMCKTQKRTEHIDPWDNVNKCSRARDASPHGTVALQVAVPKRCCVSGITYEKEAGGKTKALPSPQLQNEMLFLYSGLRKQLLDPAADRFDKH